MGDVIPLTSVDPRGPVATQEELAAWLEDMAAAIRDDRVPVRTLIVVMETSNGELGTYCNATDFLDTCRSVGLLTYAATLKANKDEDDPLGWKR